MGYQGFGLETCLGMGCATAQANQLKDQTDPDPEGLVDSGPDGKEIILGAEKRPQYMFVHGHDKYLIEHEPKAGVSRNYNVKLKDKIIKKVIETKSEFVIKAQVGQVVDFDQRN